MRRSIFIAAAAAVIAAGCVPVSSGPTQPTGPIYANAQQLFNALTNFSVVGTYNTGGSYCEFHGPTGQVSGNDPAGFFTGTWAVTGNQVCYNYPQDGIFNLCKDATIQGQRITFYENGVATESGNLIGGNTC